MSLDYDLRDIAPESNDFLWRVGTEARGEEEGARYMSSDAQSVIFATMAVGIGEITKQNYAEFWRRYDMLMTARYGQGQHSITLEGVYRMIGLKTNVFPKVTEAAFNKRVMVAFTEVANARLAKAKQELIDAGVLPAPEV